jgi:4'-phosphopantetheinyl transferase
MIPTSSHELTRGLQPVFTAPDYRVWLIDLDRYAAGQDFGVCSTAEHQRAGRFRLPSDGLRYLASHHALRVLLASGTARPPVSLNFRVNAFDKPELVADTGPYFNLSHSHQWCLIGISDTTPIGVDIERADSGIFEPALVRSHLTATEWAVWQTLPVGTQDWAFRRAWTCKEACLKALGTGLSLSPGQVELDPLSYAHATVAIGANRRRLALQVLDLGEAACAAVALTDTDSAQWAQSAARP